MRNSAGKLGTGIDVRGEGGYVLAPPSVHPSGKKYCWSVDSARAIAAAPAWLLDRIAAPANGVPVATPPSEWRALIEDGLGEGARDCTITRLVGHLLRRRVDPVVVVGLMQSFNATHCTPPLPPADIDRIVESIAGRELVRRTGSHGGFCQAELQRNPDDMLSITGCLQANRTKVSRTCRGALARHGQ